VSFALIYVKMSLAVEDTKKSCPNESKIHDSYTGPVNAMLQVATFAGAITFTVVLAPRDGDHETRGLAEIAYANSLFIGGIMGCVLIIISIELYDASINRDLPKTFPEWLKISSHDWLIPAEVGVVGITLLWLSI
jgi:hypothetical protein